MGWYVPWVIDGADHSARLFRRAYQESVGDGSGVSRPGDLKVSALSVPGQGFRVAPGGGVAQSRDTLASARETYSAINDAQIIVEDVVGTGSGSTRRDLVVLEITDPEMESVEYPAPTDPEGSGGWQDGDTFCRITVIQNVDALVPQSERPVTSLDQIRSGDYANVTGVTLAAINWPKSTGTIAPSMIEDLREVQNPRTRTEVRSFNLTGPETKERVTAQYPAFATWPPQSETAGDLDVFIPAWATVMKVVMTVSGFVAPGAGNAYGRFAAQIGANVNPNKVVTQETRWSLDGTAAAYRDSVRVADTRAVPAALRGTTQRIYPRANREFGTALQGIYADWATSVDFTVVFQESRD